MSLLDKAKEIQSTRKKDYSVDSDFMELTIALLKGEVSPLQAAKAVGITESALRNRMFVSMSHAIRQGKMDVRYDA